MKNLSIYSWNVNGIRAVHRKDQFMPFIQKHKPDILCLQETKAHQNQSEVDLPDYEEYWHSAERPGYSGTAIFTKVKPVSITLGLPETLKKKYKLDADSYGDPSKEGRVITAEFTDFYLVCVYTPNTKRDLSRLSLRYKQWDPAFLEFIKQLDKKKPVITCGDFNAAHTADDLANPKENEKNAGFTEEERKGVDKILKAGFIDTFRKFTPEGNGFYTWWTHWRNARERNIGWRIDYFFASKKLDKKIKKAEIHHDVFGSDHCPVSLTLSL